MQRAWELIRITNLADTDGTAAASSGLGVLATDTEAPVVSETTVSTDLLQTLEIIAELRVNTVGENLAVLAINDIVLTVEHPAGDLVCGRVLEDGDETLELFRGELSGALVQVDIGLFLFDRLASMYLTNELNVLFGLRRQGWSSDDQLP